MPWRLTPEEKLQIEVCKWARIALPSGAVVRSIDHGVKVNDTRRQILHARGVRGGLPDMMLWWRGKHAQIELKVGKNTQQTNQQDHERLMIEHGFHYAVCWSLEDVDAALRGWGWPLQAAIMTPVAITERPAKKRGARLSKPRPERVSASKMARANAAYIRAFTR